MDINRVEAGFHYKLKFKQIIKVISYCKKHNINYLNMSFADFININTKFQKWEWISLEYLNCLQHHKPYNLQEIKEDVLDKYNKLTFNADEN